MTEAFKARVSSTQKLVLLALCDSANDQGECYPAIHTLAEKCSLSERAAQGAISELERDGYLRRELRRGRATVYWMTPAAGAPRSSCTPAAAAPPQQMHPAANAPQGCTSCTPADPAPPQILHPRGAPAAPAPADPAPRTITKPIEEPIPNTTPAAPTTSGPAYPGLQGHGAKDTPQGSSPPPRPDDWLTADALALDGIDPELASSWLAHRRAKKAKLTALAWRGFKAEADKAGWDYAAAIVKAISRNWVGFEAAWVDGGSRQHGKHSGFDRKNYREGVTEDGHLA